MCIWSVEADIFNFDSNSIMNILYTNRQVDAFMKANNSMGIAACKGMGKTFLLKAKRLQMMNDKSILILPKDRMVDASGPIALEKIHVKFLSSYSNWVSIWTSCISIYLLSLEEFADLRKSENIEALLPESVVKLLNKQYIGVFNVLHVMLTLKSKKALNEFVKAATILFDIVQKINKQVAIFVDKLEEPFNRGYYAIPGANLAAQGNYNASIWAYAQLSFAEAVYMLYSSRNHIKIFYSIRKEALYRGEQISTEYQKLRFRITSLKYSKEDLYKMFQLYVSNENPEELCCPEYVNDNPMKALVGIDTISHRSGSNELIWNYIYRHTLQRPRDIMEMCQSIHTHIVKDNRIANNSLSRTKVLRHWINEISTMECMAYLCFLEPFMKKDDEIPFKEKIMKFAKTLPTSIYTSDSMKAFCHNANDKQNGNFNCGECENINYFATLYNVGLLGYTRKSVNDSTFSNEIKHIGESNFTVDSSSLPKAVIYYLHPGLANIVQREREMSGQMYTPCHFVVNDIDSEISCEQIRFMEDSIISIMGNLNNKRVFLSSTGRDFSDGRKRIIRILEEKGYEVMAFDSPKFDQMKNDINHENEGRTHDHCIDVMLSCKHVIYIFTGRFGGEYRGKKYSLYYEKEDVIKFKPSISFMEYLVGKNHDKNVKVYVDDKVDLARGEYLANGQPTGYQSKVVDSTKVFDQLGYFNGLGNGTWYDKFTDLSNLEEYINTHF